MAGLRRDIEREQDVIAISIRLLTSAATRAVKMPPGLTSGNGSRCTENVLAIRQTTHILLPIP